MKKIVFGLLAAVGLLATSCEKQVDGSVAADQTAKVSVNLTSPQMHTRVFSDGTTASNLQYAVYVKNGNTLELLEDLTVTEHPFLLEDQITLHLVTGRTYAFVFWAANEDAPYTVEFGAAGATMTVDYDGMKANDETLDAFYTYKELEVKGDISMEAELYRPFAQINVGTADYDEAEAAGYVPKVSHITVSNVYKTLDLVTGEVSGEVKDQEFAYNDIPTAEDGAFPVAGYDYMTMVYALVSAKQELVEVSFDCSTAAEGGEVRAEHTVGSVPVQRNFRTNIFGYLLTSAVDINVVIVPEYDGEYNLGESLVEVAPGVQYDEDGESFLVSSKDGLSWVATMVNNPDQAAENEYVETSSYTYGASAVAFAGQTIKLTGNVDLAGQAWTPIGTKTKDNGASTVAFAGTFDGAGYTISNLTVTTATNDNAGLFGATNRATIKNVTLKNVNIKSHYKTGAIVGDGYNVQIENCHVDGGTILVTPWAVSSGKYDDANNVGGIAGYLIGQPEEAWAKDCTVKNLTISAFRKVGGIAGSVSSADDKPLDSRTCWVTITGCSVENTAIIADMTETRYDSYASRVPDIGEIYGIVSSDKAEQRYTIDGNTYTNVTKTVLKAADDSSFEVADAAGLQAISELVKGGNRLSGKTVKLTEDIDLAGIEWEPISAAGNGFAGTFDGNGKTISNLTVNTPEAVYAGLFASLTGTVKDLKMEHVNIVSAGKAGAIAGGTYGHITGCAVTDVKITIAPFKAAGASLYDEGNDCGAIVGFVREGKGKQITGNRVTDAVLTGYRGVGGITGKSQDEGNIKDNVLTNVQIIGEQSKIAHSEYTGWQAAYESAFNVICADPRATGSYNPPTYNESGVGTNGDTNTVTNVTITVNKGK